MHTLTSLKSQDFVVEVS